MANPASCPPTCPPRPPQQPAASNLTIDNANSVWLSPDYALQPAFDSALAQYYQAVVEPITTADVSLSVEYVLLLVDST